MTSTKRRASTTGKAAAATTEKLYPRLPVSEATARRMQHGIGELSTATLHRLDEKLGWYRALSAEDRSWVGLVAQAGISAFVDWFKDSAAPLWMVPDIFSSAPRELTRAISLQQTLQLVRIVVDVVEERVVDLAEPEDSAQLREGVLRFSREIAFAAADIYAHAAEVRGSWDARLEALVVDALIRGEADVALNSRIAALGWRSSGAVLVAVGPLPPHRTTRDVTLALDEMRRAGRRAAEDAMVGTQGELLLVVLGGRSRLREAAASLVGHFGEGPVVVGPTVEGLAQAGASAHAALAGAAAARAWPGAPVPVLADELLPERALSGDRTAAAELVARVYAPLNDAPHHLIDTVSTYVEQGRSLEATARTLFVHPNTVRYRLGRTADLIGWDVTKPREAFVVQTALALGRLDAPVP